MSEAVPTAVDRAAERLKNFMLVTASRPKGERADSIQMFAESVGLSPKEHRELRAHFEKATKDEMNVSWAVIGVIVGLFLADER